MTRRRLTDEEADALAEAESEKRMERAHAEAHWDLGGPRKFAEYCHFCAAELAAETGTDDE